MAQQSSRVSNLSESIESAVKDYCDDRERDDTRTKGDGFAIWCLTNIFGLEREEAIDAIVDGKGDRSVDAIVSDGNRLLVLQAKYNSHGWSEITKFRTDIEQVSSGKAQNLPARLRPAAARLRDIAREGLPAEYYYITNQRFTGDDESKIGSLGQGEPAIKALDLDGLFDEILERQSERPLNAPDRAVSLRFTTAPLAVADSLVMAVSLTEFARFVKAGERWLFDSNVRQYLAKSRINQGIRKTVEEDPEHFWRYNNGVTMVVDDFSLEASAVALSKPQIVNGCQTSLSISRVVDGMDAEQKDGLVGTLLIRVIKESSDDERRSITEYTNKQNAVRGKDFFALKDFQRLLKRRIDRLGYFYEIQTGSFDFLSRSQKEALHGDPRFAHLGWARRDYRVPAIEAAKCNAASRGEIAVCYANPGDLAPNGSLYDTIFPADLPDSPEPFLLPFLLMKHAEQALGYGSTKGQSWRRRGRYAFVFTLFKILNEALERADRLEQGETISASRLGEVVASKDVVIPLVALTDKVMENFFLDSAVGKVVNNDIFAFLKGPIQKKEQIEILDAKIRYSLDGEEGRTIRDAIRTALPN